MARPTQTTTKQSTGVKVSIVFVLATAAVATLLAILGLITRLLK